MGFKGAFKKIGKALGKVGLTTGKILAKVDDIPFAENAIAMIPVAGPILAAAAKRCDMAEGLFESGQGAKKKEWAKAQLKKDLLKMGVEEKYIDELVSLGLLVGLDYGKVLEAKILEEDKEPEPDQNENPAPEDEQPAASTPPAAPPEPEPAPEAKQPAPEPTPAPPTEEPVKEEENGGNG